jgi:hypothetical protein
VNDDILSRFKYLYLSYHRFGQKEAKRGRNVRRRIEFFRKRREKRETYFQGEDGVCFMKSERADQAKVFQESAKKKTKILILAHVFTTLNKTHLHKHHVCCYSTNRVHRRPQGHQGSGTSEFRFASRAVKVDFERRR